jgi:hypothetical protein
VACPPRIERGTWGLEDPCSIQLSYGHRRTSFSLLLRSARTFKELIRRENGFYYARTFGGGEENGKWKSLKKVLPRRPIEKVK